MKVKNWMIRVDEVIHAKAKLEACKNRVSLQDWMTDLIEKGVSEENKKDSTWQDKYFDMNEEFLWHLRNTIQKGKEKLNSSSGKKETALQAERVRAYQEIIDLYYTLYKEHFKEEWREDTCSAENYWE